MNSIRTPFPIFLSIEAIFLILLALFLCSNPLHGAFAYDFFAYYALGVGTVLSIGVALRVRRLLLNRPILRHDYRRVVLSSILTILPGILICLLLQFVWNTCRFDIGFYWLLLLIIPSATFATGSGLWAATKERGPIHTVLLAIFPAVFFLILSVVDIFSSPSLFFHHPFTFISGPIYQPHIPFTWSLVSYRAWIFLLGGSMIAYACAKKMHPQAARRWRIGVIALLSIFAFRQTWGWHFSSQYIKDQLGNKIEKGPIRIFYDPETKHVKEFARAVQYRVLSIRKELKLNRQDPIDVYLFPNTETKRVLMGTGNIAIGNPLHRSIYLPPTDPFETLIPHELTHVLAAEFGLPGVGLTVRIGLLEGLATAIERYRGRLSVHEWAKAMLDLGLLPDMNDVMHMTKFWREPPARSYLSAGSFCRWLMDEYGVRKLKKVYRGHSFSSVYMKPLSTLVRNWETFLQNRIHLTEKGRDLAEHHLKAKGIFEQNCPHDVASAEHQGLTCEQNGDSSKAMQFYEDALMYSGGASSQLLHLAEVKLRQGVEISSKSSLQKLAENEKRSPMIRARANKTLGDASLFQNQLNDAVRMWKNGLEFHTSFWTTEALYLRIEMVQAQRDADLKLGITKGLSIDHIERFRKDFEIEKLPYTALWVSRKLGHMGEPDQAISLLNKLKNNPSLEYRRERLHLLARLQEEKGEIAKARDLYRKLMKYAETMGDQFQAADQILRLNDYLQ